MPKAAPKTIPKIIIDARMIGEIPHGIARYVAGLLRGLLEIGEEPGFEPRYSIGLLVEAGFSSRAVFQKQLMMKFEIHEIRSRFLSPWEILEIPGALRALGASLYHSPSFSSLIYAPCPWIVTLHDLNHLTYGDWKERLYYRTLLRSFLRRAGRVVTVSDFSRNEIARWMERETDSISLVRNAIEYEPSGISIVNRFALDRGKFFLCFSNSKPHKNIFMLDRAYEAYRARSSDPWPLVTNVPELAGPGRVTASGLNDEEGRALLQAAGAVVFPSVYEGFGLLPLEAGVSGIPLVISDIAAHRESFGQFARGPDAVFISPSDEAAWAHAMFQAEQGRIPPLKQELRNELLSFYSSKRAALEMDRIYRSMLG